MRWLAAAAILGWLVAVPPTQVAPAQDGVTRLLREVELAVASGDPSRYTRLASPRADLDAAQSFAESLIASGLTRAVVRERDRYAPAGEPPGSAYRVTADVFSEFGTRARVVTCELRVTRGDGDRWTIETQDVTSSFGGLHRLGLARKQYAARNLAIAAEDFELRLPAGAVFTADTDEGATVAVLLGKGQMLFKPTPRTEQEQLRIFAGRDQLETSFSAAFVRVSPGTLKMHVSTGALDERPVDQAAVKAAEEIFRTDNPKSFAVNIPDMTADTWSLAPRQDDFLCEVHTQRFGILTFVRSSSDAEDISLFDRERRHNISSYRSRERLAEHGRFYADDDAADYEVKHYDIDVSLDPPKQTVDGKAVLDVVIRGEGTSALTMRLAERLIIDSVVSREFGRVVALPIRNQNAFVVNLPRTVAKGTELGFLITYHGRVPPQPVDREAISSSGVRGPMSDVKKHLGRRTFDFSPRISDLGHRTLEVAPPQERQDLDAREAPPLLEPSYLYSTRSFWYPQSQAPSFATATLRLRVPPGFACVASGEPTPETAEALAKPSRGSAEFVFRAAQPVRYLSALITRLLPVGSTLVAPQLDEVATRDSDLRGGGSFYSDIDLWSFSSPRMRSRGLALTDRAADVLKFYAGLMGDCPYPSLTLAVVERELPGGHSPAYLAVLSEPTYVTSLDWRSDPTAFVGYPEFFLAHELAHQWWGQAIGWKNYHEQWLSEGLAQYFSALYAERMRGKALFDAVIRQMQSWAMRKSSEGPVYLGYRIGHVKADPQVFRAIIYNKSAAVLHMLRRLLGDEAFFRGLRRFYHEWRFKSAGSEDLRKAFEIESGRSLSRFFERWIYDSRLPHLRFSWHLVGDPGGGAVAVVRFEQVGDVFDVPVTVTLNYSDRSSHDTIVAVTDQVTEVRLPLAGKLRGVDVNRDQAAVARIDK